jgi:hypothetical protein
MTLKQTEIYQKVKIEQSERRLMQIKLLDLDSSRSAIPVIVDTVKLTAALDTLSDVNAISQTLFDLLDREQEESTSVCDDSHRGGGPPYNYHGLTKPSL